MSKFWRIIINGVEFSPDDACISIFDRGFQFGDGLFETLPVVDGEAVMLDRHMARLCAGCETLGIPLDACIDAIINAIRQIAVNVPRAALKVIVSRGQTTRGYACPADISLNWVVSLSEFPQWPTVYQLTGINICFCKTPASRNVALAGLKHLNRLENVLARRELTSDEQEGLLLDETGCVVEGVMSNIFVVRNGIMITPDLTHSGVCGIMRDYLLELAKSLALTVRTERLPAAELATVDELFVCNSLIGIWPIKKIKHVGKYKKGPITEKIQQALVSAHPFLADV